jgi:hypothetical protein
MSRFGTQAFHAFLRDTCIGKTGEERDAALANWESAPGARQVGTTELTWPGLGCLVLLRGVSLHCCSAVALLMSARYCLCLILCEWHPVRHFVMALCTLLTCLQSHPREEHLLPLHVITGAAGDSKGKLIQDGVMMGTVPAYSFLFND